MNLPILKAHREHYLQNAVQQYIDLVIKGDPQAVSQIPYIKYRAGNKEGDGMKNRFFNREYLTTWYNFPGLLLTAFLVVGFVGILFSWADRKTEKNGEK